MERRNLWVWSLLALALPLLCGCERDHIGEDGEVAVHVERVGLDANDVPVVILGENEGARWLPIWIGSAEARSIARVMADRHSPRPNTHDLTRNVIEGLEAEVLRVVVTELRNDTYYATLALRMRGQVVVIDSRPSDAIAIALRTHTPIFVRDTLFDDPDGNISPSGEDGDGQLQI